jgi:hypothetical protein
VLDCALLDLIAAFADAITLPEVDIGRLQIVEALMVAAMIVVLAEVVDGALEITGQVVVFEQDALFNERCVGADLSLRRVTTLLQAFEALISARPIMQ